MVQLHKVPVTAEDDLSMRGKALRKAMADDRRKGLIPFFVSLHNCFIFKNALALICTVTVLVNCK